MNPTPGSPAETAALVSRPLDLLSAAALKKIAQTLNLPRTGNDRGRTISILAAFIGTRAHREFLERHLTGDDWSLLGALPLRRGPFRLRVILVALRERGVGPDAALNAASRLLAHGCILSATSLGGTSHLGIEPRDLRAWSVDMWYQLAPGVAEWASSHDAASLRLSPVSPPATAAASNPVDLQRAVYILLAEARLKPIRFTQKGAPYRSEINRLAAALAGAAGSPARRVKRSTDPAVLPFVWFSLAAVLSAGLLNVASQELVPAEDADEFFNLPSGEQVRRLINGWAAGPYDDLLRVSTLAFYSADPDVPWDSPEDYNASARHAHVALARVLIVSALRVTGAEDAAAWYALDDLAELVYHQNRELLFDYYSDYELLQQLPGRQRDPNNPPIYFEVYRAGRGSARGDPRPLQRDRDWREVEGAYVRQCVTESLRWLGVVELGPDVEHAACFRLTPIGRYVLLGEPLRSEAPTGTTDRAVVQPNYEIVVMDAMANPALLAQLDAFAERRSLDRAATYRLTQADLVRGLDNGWTGPRIFELLSSFNGGSLPQNVRYTLAEWIALYERLSVRERATILEADDPAQLDRWLADRKIAALVGGRLGPTSVLVPSAHRERVAKLVGERAQSVPIVDYAQRRTGLLEIHDPDRIVVRSQVADPYLTYRLRAFATTVEQSKQHTLYQITRESVIHALDDGWKGPQLVDFLATAAGRPLPPDVLTRLLGWSGAIPPASCEPLVLVRLTGDQVEWAMLRAIPSIGSLLRATPSPELALVSPDNLEALRRELDARGIATRSETIPPEAIETRTEADLVQSMVADALRAELGPLASALGLPENVVPLFRPGGKGGFRR